MTAPTTSRIPEKGRRRALGPVLLAVGVAVLLVVGALVRGAGPEQARAGNALRVSWSERAEGQQVLGGTREPGVPTISRLRHDAVDFTVTVAPARPGPNLVRIDTSHMRPGGRHADRPAYVGLSGSPDPAFVRAVPRPGTDGLWAVLDLPTGSGTVLVTHGRFHRVPFPVDTGTREVDTSLWTGPDGPECLAAATAELLAGGDGTGACPAAALDTADAEALTSTVSTLASRGVEEIALDAGSSARGQEAAALVRREAAAADIAIVSPTTPPGTRSALLVVSGWSEAARSLAAVSSRPLEQQPIRSDGTWVAPWLLTPGVVDSTSGVVVALDFDIREAGALEYADTLGTYLPGQSPTASGYAAWRARRGEAPAHLGLYAAARTAFLPNQPGHEAHSAQVAWFPGGTVTPVGSL